MNDKVHKAMLKRLRHAVENSGCGVPEAYRKSSSDAKAEMNAYDTFLVDMEEPEKKPEYHVAKRLQSDGYSAKIIPYYYDLKLHYELSKGGNKLLKFVSDAEANEELPKHVEVPEDCKGTCGAILRHLAYLSIEAG
ncbi:MAG: hypothetical protein WCO52_03445 [bacterium]